MSNVINKIRLSGTDYTLSATTSGGVTSGEVETMISAATSGYTARFAEDEEVTAAALNDLNERISGISGNNVVELTQAQYDALVSGGTVDPTAFYIITDATPVDISNYWTSAQTQSAINQATAAKQDTLVSGTNIKTINNESILGSGNIDIQGGGVNVVQTTGYSTTDVMSQDAVTLSINSLEQSIPHDYINSISGEYNDEFFRFGTPNEYNYFGLKNAKINGRQVLSSDWSSQDDNEYNLVETSAITTSISSRSTNTQVPSAKAMYNKFDEVEQVTARALNELNDAVSGKVDTSTFNTYSGNVETALSGKQDTLSAGTGIDITDNVISATGGGGKAVSGGTNISVTTGETADTINCTLPIKTNAWNSLTFNSSRDPSQVLYSCAFGDYTTASAESSFAIGKNTIAQGIYSFAGGFNNTKSIGATSFAFGEGIIARGSQSVAFGYNNTTNNFQEFASGKFNNSVTGSTDADNTLFSVGNGTASDAKHNAFEIRQNGDIYCSDGTNDVKLQDTITATAANTTALGGLKLVKLTQAEYDALATKDNSTLYVIVN